MFPPPLIIGPQELKTYFFLTVVALNVIHPNYHRVISLPFEDRGGTTLLFHPSLKLIDFGTMSRGRATSAQLHLDTSNLLIAIIYAPSDSPWKRAYLWHHLKTELPNNHWILLGNFNMTENPLDSSGPFP